MATLPAAAVAFALALLAAFPLLWLLRRMQLFDVPNARSSHRTPTPRAGGLAPAAACVVAGAAATRLTGANRDAVLLVAIGAGLIGLADDMHSRPPVVRFVGQLAVAVVALPWLLHGLGGPTWVDVAAAGAVVIALVGYINVFNFMDGINGLAVAQVCVAGVAWWLIGSYRHLPALASAGLIPAAAAAAFAPFNVPRARMFLGDVGSYFFGAWLMAVAIVGLRARVAPEAMLAPLAVFVADAGFTLVQRVRHHEPWLEAHQQHAYQRLVQSGWSHGRTSLVAVAVMATVSALGALSLTGNAALRVVGDTAAVLVAATYLAMPALLARARGRTTSTALEP